MQPENKEARETVAAAPSLGSNRDRLNASNPTNQPKQARLHPHWVGGRDGYRYSVLFEGQLLVGDSRDPECDAARALVAKGLTGKLTMLDGETGRPRTIIDIEKAARFTLEETGGVPRFRKHRERGGSEGCSPESRTDGRVGGGVMTGAAEQSERQQLRLFVGGAA